MMNSSYFRPQNASLQTHPVMEYCLFNISLVTADNADHSKVSTPITVWKYLAIVICFLGCAINIFVLILVQLSPQLRKGPGVIISHLLAVDLVLCGIAVPVRVHSIVKLTSESATASSHCETCRYSQFLAVTFTLLVVWSDALLAVNRLIAVFFPLQFGRVNRKSIHSFGLIFCWISTLVYTIPPAFEYSATYKMNAVGSCMTADQTRLARMLLNFNSYCPMIAVLAAAVLIVSRMYCVDSPGRLRKKPSVGSTNVVTDSAPLRKQLLSDRQKRISKMLLLTFLVSFLCEIPQYVLIVTGGAEYYPISGIYCWLFSVIHFTVAPVVFLATNCDYRQTALGFWNQLNGTALREKTRGDFST